MSEFIINISGEHPREAPNPSESEAFNSLYPKLFAPLQTETFDRIRAGRSLALVAPTSSGKTLAVAAPLFESKKKTVFVYPFRALVLDQTNQLVRYASPFGIEESDFAQVMGGTPERELARAIEKDYILMTPDKLVSLFMSGRRTPQVAAQTILTKYVFVFDEIHAYNSLMKQSLLCFIRSIKYWREDGRGQPPAFYFLSATFPENLWETLKKELEMNDDDRLEGISNTGNVSLVVRPNKDDASLIAQEMTELGMDDSVIAIFNTAVKAWQVAEKLWGSRLAQYRLFVGQDKMSEFQRVEAFRRFAQCPQDGGLCGSPAIEAGVDFDAEKLVIEETFADSFLQRFGRTARSGRDAKVLCYSSFLYDALQKGAINNTSYTRQEFLEVAKQILPLREPKNLLAGLAAYPYYKFWGGPDFLETDTMLLCKKLESKGVDHLLAFRGFIPYTHYQTGEAINYRTLFRKDLKVVKGIVEGTPDLARYYYAKRRPSVLACVKDIAHIENIDDATTILLAKVSFEGFKTYWTVLEYKSFSYEAMHPLEPDDNICLRGLPQGEIGRISENTRNGILRFYDVDA